MKKITLLLFVFMLFSCKTSVFAPKIVKLSTNEVAAAEKNKAYELGKRILNSCNTSRFKPFTTAEATETVIKNITPEKISRTCQKFLLKYGAFKDIELVEIIQNNAEKTKIFRYKAIYEKKYIVKELQVTMNQDNKVAAIKSTDWSDLYKP